MPQIRVQDFVKSDLENLKEHKDEPIGDVVKRLVDYWKNNRREYAEEYVSETLDFLCIEKGISMFYYYDGKMAGGIVDYDSNDFDAGMQSAFDLLVDFELKREK